jgi:hypothetical protein
MRPFEPSNIISLNNKNSYYLNDDNPRLGYQTLDISFVAQPIYKKDVNKKFNVVPVPLMMTDEWNIINEMPQIINELRDIKKEYDYLFIGQCHYMGRGIFRNLNIQNYYFRENSRGIFHFNAEDKKVELIKFLKEIAKSKFIFCPRGVGSSSFRLYQTMMVGSVPIETGMNDYPFNNEVDWDDFCISGELKDIYSLIQKSKQIDFEKYRKNGMQFWDKFCRHDELKKRLEERYG